jgi:ABC-type multidrug transport system fused ATPase/permease subunit
MATGLSGVARGLSIGSFAMLVAAASGFSTALNALGANIMYLRQNCRFMRPFQEYLALPEKMRAGDSRVANGTVEIEFDHVTFTYPRGQAPVLKDVTLKIAAGERLAIVGSTAPARPPSSSCWPGSTSRTPGASAERRGHPHHGL